mgnify:FL=1
MKIKKEYNKIFDILTYNWGEVKESVELFEGRLIIDFDKNLDIVGFEFIDFIKEVNIGDERIQNLLNNSFPSNIEL